MNVPFKMARAVKKGTFIFNQSLLYATKLKHAGIFRDFKGHYYFYKLFSNQPMAFQLIS